MKLLVSASLLTLLLTACASGPVAPAWEGNAKSALDNTVQNYLTGNTKAEEQDYARAYKELAATGRADLLARAELTRCAARVALLRCGIKIAIIGGGPAGLRAAEVAAAGGASVTLYDAKPSVGRKFLVAGRGGLNLTHAEPRERFAARYTGTEQPPDFWNSLLAEFDADALRQWAADLGVETFAATSGRVYPREMKAAPLKLVERLLQLDQWKMTC